MIPVETQYIEYKESVNKRLLPNKIKGEIWIPSRFDNSLSLFGEVVASALSVKNNKIVWKGPNSSLVIQVTRKDKFESFFLWAVYVLCSIVTKINLRLKGYKWKLCAE